MPGQFPGFDLYEELEVSPRASEEVIPAAYRRLRRRFVHPDHYKGPDSGRMTRLNVAHEFLSDSLKRADYDRQWTGTQAEAQARAQAGAIVIGLTGGIASGKSTAAEQLRKNGAVIIDADRVGHRSYEPGTPGFEKLVNAFWRDTVGKDGLIDRRVLGGKVFGAPQKLERLNAILWPEIRRLIGEEIAQIREHDKDSVIVVEAAVLIEAGWQDLCDQVGWSPPPPRPPSSGSSRGTA